MLSCKSPDCLGNLCLACQALQRKRVLGILHDAVLKKVRMSVIESRAHKSIPGVNYARFKTNVLVRFMLAQDINDATVPDYHGTCYGFQRIAGKYR